MNNDLDSHVLLAKFIMQAKSTAKELKETYNEYWIDPAKAVEEFKKESELLLL